MELSKDLNLTVQQKERILDKIRNDNQGRNSFKNFLSKEFADENLLFVEAVEKFDQASPDDRFEMGYKIFDNFVKAGSDKEVNIEAATRKKIIADIQASKIQKFMFKDASKEVLDTLRDDNLIRYMKSNAYETYIKRLREETESIKKASPGAKKTPKGSDKKDRKKDQKKSPSPGPKSPGASPMANRPSPESAETFDDVLDLMFQVYEDVFEQSFGDTLMDLENKHKDKNKGNAPANINDFEMFLAASGGEAYAGTPPPKKKKEKKEKDKDAKSDTPKKKKSSFFQRMTDDNKKKEKKKDDKKDKKKGDDKEEDNKEEKEKEEEKKDDSGDDKKPGSEDDAGKEGDEEKSDDDEDGEVMIIQKAVETPKQGAPMGFSKFVEGQESGDGDKPCTLEEFMAIAK